MENMSVGERICSAMSIVFGNKVLSFSDWILLFKYLLFSLEVSETTLLFLETNHFFSKYAKEYTFF